MLGLWLSSQHRHEPWSVHNRFEELTNLFKKVRLPSTTTRLPRTLSQYSNFKANELRVLLLFGYIIFNNILPEMYYNHLLKLVCLMHLAENRHLSIDDIDFMQILGETFVVSFSDLYTNRHCVQVVHSTVHIATTVRDFGPLTNYTTFNFEGHLGTNMRLLVIYFFFRFRHTDTYVQEYSTACRRNDSKSTIITVRSSTSERSEAWHSFQASSLVYRSSWRIAWRERHFSFSRDRNSSFTCHESFCRKKAYFLQKATHR